MKGIFRSFFKIILLAVICYSILAIPAFPFSLIPNNYYHNNLTIILLTQSTFLVSGLLLILLTRNSPTFTKINFNFYNATIYYFSTILIIILFCCVLFLFDIIDFKVTKTPNLTSLIQFLVFCTIPTFFIGFGEEFIFRWFLIKRLEPFIKTNGAIIIGSLIFCLGHNWNIPNMLFAFSIGCLFGIIFIRTKSIFYTVSIHSAWNFGQRFFFSGMSEFQFNSGRVILLDIKNLDLYNWIEFIFGGVILLGFITYYTIQDNGKKGLFPEQRIL